MPSLPPLRQIVLGLLLNTIFPFSYKMLQERRTSPLHHTIATNAYHNANQGTSYVTEGHHIPSFSQWHYLVYDSYHIMQNKRMKGVDKEGCPC